MARDADDGVDQRRLADAVAAEHGKRAASASGDLNHAVNHDGIAIASDDAVERSGGRMLRDAYRGASGMMPLSEIDGTHGWIIGNV